MLCHAKRTTLMYQTLIQSRKHYVRNKKKISCWNWQYHIFCLYIYNKFIRSWDTCQIQGKRYETVVIPPKYTENLTFPEELIVATYRHDTVCTEQDRHSFGKCSVRISNRLPAILTRGFSGFSYVPPEGFGNCISIGSRSLPSKSFPQCRTKGENFSSAYSARHKFV
jgi:hypothetical protein